MPEYFSHFRYKSLTTANFKDFLYRWFTEKHGESMKKNLDEIDWQAWFYGRGMPPVTPRFDKTLAIPAYSLADKWIQAASENTDPAELDFKNSDLQGWFAQQICT